MCSVVVSTSYMYRISGLLDELKGWQQRRIVVQLVLTAVCV